MSLTRKEKPARPLPLGKKLLFAAATVGGFFLLLEAALTLGGVRPAIVDEDPFVGFAGNVPLFVEQLQPDGSTSLITAPDKRELFNLQSFPRHKVSGTYRIFCLGGSTTYGHPYDDRSSFPGWLRELLPRADGSHSWEVVNAGGISYASYRVAALMEELAQYEPDLFIVYTGHNEFLEQRTYRDLIRLPAPLVRASATLARTRTYSALRSLMVAARPARHDRFQLAAEVDARLDHSVGPADYHRDDVTRRRIVEHFELNLRRMVQIAATCQAQVMFVAPASNLKDCSPFKSEHHIDLKSDRLSEWNALYRQARQLEEDGRPADAAATYQQAAAIDDRFADLYYRQGRCLLQLQLFDAARAALVRARDEDVCPLRALSEIVDVVRNVAAETRAPLVDYEAMVERRSLAENGHSLPGNEQFLDHVHPTIDGNRRLATALVDEMANRQIVRLSADWPDAAVAETTTAVEGRLDPAAQGVALRNVAKVFSWAGKIDEAGPAAINALTLLPDDRESLFIAGAYLEQRGRWAEGVEFYRRALELELQGNPDDVEARQFLAAALAEQGKLDEARTQYEAALQRRPTSVDAHRGLATVLARQGNRESAREHFEAALRLNPRDAKSAEGLKELSSPAIRSDPAPCY